MSLGKFIFFIIIFLFVFSCQHKNEREGFLSITELEYKIKHKKTKDYPKIIDEKVRNSFSPNFNDSLKENKEVYVKIKTNLTSGKNEKEIIDTTGYLIMIYNDSLKLIWELEIDENLQITHSTEMSYELKKKLIEEGKKIRRKW